MFQTACSLREHGGWEVQPSEFWGMTPYDWWRLYDANVGYRVREQIETMDRLKRLYHQQPGGS